ncbi:MAG: MBL fold metallo-hydrolase [Frankiaceae bacterium]|nr:MBL fold metallo-hydrolase [Frankiaceae bacterium]MBV9871803.1 MBL fold metallo-hydrolase [Frankiaceae bacterium]
MLVVGFPAGPFGTNCWIVAPGSGEQCVVIDPGVEAEGPLDDVLAEYRLQPVAVLLTHGHLDHMFSVTPVCGAKDVPALIHPADRPMLTDPAMGLGVPPGTPIFGRLSFAEPDDVRELVDGETLELAGLSLRVDATPGHTEGSVTFLGGGELFSGDLLFAGSIGRTDLPGGSWEQMQRSLAFPLTLPDETVVRPGHGPDTTIGRERLTNPFLVDLAAQSPVRRGL